MHVNLCGLHVVMIYIQDCAQINHTVSSHNDLPFLVPMDLDVKMKAVMIGAVFLIVSMHKICVCTPMYTYY